jgi:hypothetical protein
MCEFVDVSTKDVREMAETLARNELGISAEEAWRRMDAGEFDGTILEAELHQLRFLLSEPERSSVAPCCVAV